MDPIPITTLTSAAVQQNLQSDGLDTLGLATLSLSPRWSDTTPNIIDYKSDKLTLNISALRAPYRGILEFAFSPVASTLASNITESDTILNVAAGDGNKFPNPSGGSYLLTLSNMSGSKMEVVECIGRTGDAFTVTRGANGTAKQVFGSGDKVALRLGENARIDSYYGANGNPLCGIGAIYRLHPQAALRLETIAAQRYGSPGNRSILPIPSAMVVRGPQGFIAARWFEADEVMTGIGGDISFHDQRGLIIDPIYAAALFADLQDWLPGLLPKNPSGGPNSSGGVKSISSLSSGTIIQFVDLHGAVYQAAQPNVTLLLKSTGGSERSIPVGGLITLNPDEGIEAPSSDNGRLRWGWATNGILTRNRLTPPVLPTSGTPPPSLNRQFYRVAVVDTVWALLGNRTSSTLLGIGPDDQTAPSEMLPLIRDNLMVDYLVDGPDVLGQASQVLDRSPQEIAIAVSPVIDGMMAVPTQAGPNAHWPAFPTPNSGAGFSGSSQSPADGITAVWVSANDVLITIQADRAPVGSHIRIFPQQFVEIAAIAEEPSFLRADGGAAIVQAGVATQILLSNPFNLASGQQKPDPANLTLDIVVAPRAGQRKVWAGVNVQVSGGPAMPPSSPFEGGNQVNSIPATFQSVSPVPLFGIRATVTPPGTVPTGVTGFVRALASEIPPRQGPRLPTMARLETIILTGTTGGTPSGALNWEAVLSGGRWAPETRSALHASGNPGNPAGPDIHTSGIHVTGALAYDLARHAMRRTQPVIPLLPLSSTPGWVVAMSGDDFEPPTDNTFSNTGIGVLLETVSAFCETPELSVLPSPAQSSSLQDTVNAIASWLGVSAPTVSLSHEQRLKAEVRREFTVSKAGLCDALWSLRRAVRQARELVYIESPQFARTAIPSGTANPQEIDLVAEIVTSLQSNPNLKVIVCTPREADFAKNYRGWSRQHFQARALAVSNLLAVAPDRVAVFHPVGFPGRAASIRTTTVIVDDVWILIGATHWRRRGMTFDGSAAIASFDRQIENGYSKNVRMFRRALMAAKMDVQMPAAGSSSSEWIRLGNPRSAFRLVADWLREGGLGKIQPLWPGPSDMTVQAASDNIADPNGYPDASNGSTFVATFANLIAELGD